MMTKPLLLSPPITITIISTPKIPQGHFPPFFPQGHTLPLLVEAAGALLLPRLAAVRPPALRLLVAAHARADRDVDPWRRREAEALGHLGQVQLVDVEDGAQRVAGVRVQVAAVAVLGALVEVVVLVDELLQQRLDVGDLVGREVELHHRHARLLEVRQEPDLARLQEHEGSALAVGSARRPADAVDVVARVIGRVDLDDPVYCGDLGGGIGQGKDERKTYIQTTGGDVSADERALLGVAKLEKGVGPLLLLLLAVQVQHRQVDVVEQLGVVLDRVATAEEDNDLLLEVALEEREEQQEALVGVADDVPLLQVLDSAVQLLLVDVDVQRARPQRDAGEILDLCRLRGREEHRLAVVLGQDLDDLAHLVLETDLQYPVRLVDDEGLEVLEDEGRVLQVVQQTAGRRDQQVHALLQLVGLGAAVGAADDDAVRLRVVRHQLPRDAKDLQRQLARRRHDDDTRAVAGLEAQRVKHLDGGDQKGERLAGACLGRAEHVLAAQQRRDAPPLDLGHLGEAHLLYRLHSLLRQIQLGKVVCLGARNGREREALAVGEVGAVRVVGLLRGRLHVLVEV
ncbi:hypothetical protein CTA1_6381 [Colletotrichum tanaceti]|uniref:Uncharacterized protein n=1 Tax=Colletotrichum tanaceti TaxID=1306861 RepID=A0A4U6XMC0_9PEZI|nr:hypothetical protein CTA1_6381 [Colletotrichum tanaceti]